MKLGCIADRSLLFQTSSISALVSAKLLANALQSQNVTIVPIQTSSGVSLYCSKKKKKLIPESQTVSASTTTELEISQRNAKQFRNYVSGLYWQASPTFQLLWTRSCRKSISWKLYPGKYLETYIICSTPSSRTQLMSSSSSSIKGSWLCLNTSPC